MQLPSSATGRAGNIKEFLHRILPEFGIHLAKELKDEKVQRQVMSLAESLQKDFESAEKSHQALANYLESSEQEATKARQKLQQMKEEKEFLEKENARLLQRIGQCEGDLVELQSNFMDQIHKAPAYASLREEFEILQCEREEIVKRLRVLQGEISRRDEEKARLNGLLEERDAKIHRLEDEVRDVAASQLHPSKVAELRADLKRTRHECQALSQANSVLRSSIATLQQRPLESVTPAVELANSATPLPEEVSLIQDLCTRGVFNRLYEDAIRRRELDAVDPPRPSESWAGCASHWEQEKRPHSASCAVGQRLQQAASSVARSRSEPPQPPRSRSSGVVEMLRSNAQSLRDTLDEPLFFHNLRLPVSPALPPTLDNLPGLPQEQGQL